MGDLARKAASCACAAALAAGMIPAAAFAAGEVTAGQADVLTQKADAIDALGDGAYEGDSIIVVYREGAEETAKAERGVETMRVDSVGPGREEATVLAADAGPAEAGAAMSVTVPDGMSVGQAVASAEEDPDVLYAQPNYRYRLLDDPADASIAESVAGAVSGVAAARANGLDGASEGYDLPNDPCVGVWENDTADEPTKPNQWWLYAVNAPAAWRQVHGDDNQVAVAVLDTGIDFDHEDLKANILADYAYDAFRKAKMTDSIDDEEMQHGCHVAGIIAAEADNGKGIAGVSYNAKVLPIRVFHVGETGQATCSDEDLIAAYDYLLSDEDPTDGDGRSVAEKTGTHVVNMSLGGYLQDEADYYGGSPMDYYDYAFEGIIKKAQDDADILTVAAAGNGENGWARTDASYPSDFDDVMGVMALKTVTAHTQWSDYNDHKNISAPGNNVYSTYWSPHGAYSFKGAPYAFESGTSMATPVVCGCAALLWAYDPNLTVADVKEAIYGTAAPLSGDAASKCGHGRIDVAAALASLGTARVSAESSTMTRTGKQTLSAAEIADPTATHSWAWSVAEAYDADGNAVDPADIVRLSQNGELTALRAGKVVIAATAADDARISGKRAVKISEIEIPAGIAATANPSESTIAVRWTPASAAKRYLIERATEDASDSTRQTPGPFAEVATVSADAITADGTACYLDATKSGAVPNGVEPGVLYWYRVTPIGELAGGADSAAEEVMGKTTAASKRCFFTDKRALKAAIEESNDLIANTKVSENGAGIPRNVLWATKADRQALMSANKRASSAYFNGTFLQETVDERTCALEDAIKTFKKARHKGAVKLANTLAVKKVDAKASFAKLKKGSLGLTVGSLTKTGVGKITVSNASTGAVKKWKVAYNAKAKKVTVTVPKKTAKKTYVVKYAVKAAGNADYKAASKTVTAKVTVK